LKKQQSGPPKKDVPKPKPAKVVLSSSGERDSISENEKIRKTHWGNNSPVLLRRHS
jgi:hypothetical protein